MRVEDTILDHDGLRLAARRLGCSYGDALHALLRVWRALYRRGGSPMSEDEIDVISGRDGLARALLSEGVGLASFDESGNIRLAGSKRAEKYGSFLAAQRANSAVAKEVREIGKVPTEVVDPTIRVPLGLPTELPLGVPLSVPVLDLSSLRSDPDPESGRPDPHRMAREAASSWVEWFNRKFGRSMRANGEMVKQVKALMVLGYSEKPDMRGVALYLRSKWQDDDKMRVHLVPSTILRPTKFAERLDLAREWSPELWEGGES